MPPPQTWTIIGVTSGILITFLAATWRLSKEMGKKLDKRDCDVKYSDVLLRLSEGDRDIGILDERIKTLTEQNKKQQEITAAQERVLLRLEAILERNGKDHKS